MTGTIYGVVIHSGKKEALIGVNVLLLGTKFGSITNSEGKFKIKYIPIGTYQIRASLIGYASVIKTDILVNPVKPTEIIMELEENELMMETSEIKAQYFTKSSDTQISTQTQSNEEIRRLPGGLEDVVRAISILPGVAQVQPGRNDLIVRGGAPSENLFVMDNLEIPNINHFGTQGASGGPLSFINLDFVNGTSFSSGGFGARYGDKLSSVLTLDLRDGRKDKIGGKLNLSASQFGLNLEGPVNEKSSFLFSARRSYLDFVFKAAGFGFVPEYWDFLGKASYQPDAKNQLSFVGIAVMDNVKYFNTTPKQLLDNSRILGSDQQQYFFDATWKHLLPFGYSTLTFGQTNVDYDFEQRDTLLTSIFSNSSYEHESSLRGEFVMEIAKHSEITLGAIGKAVNFHSKMYLRPFWTNYGQLISVNRPPFDTVALKAAAFAQLSENLHPIRITFGLRGDYFNIIKNSFTISPRISATLSLSTQTKINMSVGKYVQAPSYIWLVANAQNRNLNFIEANQYILGLEHNLRNDTKFSLEGYKKIYSDYPASTIQPQLVLANTGAGYGGSQESFASFGLDPLVSKGKGEAHGIELFLQKKLSETPYYGTISVSYNESRFTALDGILRPSSFDQRWIINIGGGYIYNEKWETSAKFRFASGRPYTPYNSNGTQNVQLYNSERVGNNHSLDVRVDRRWAFNNWLLITYIDIQNIYNHKPLDVPKYNERTHKTEQNDSIGILPSIGVNAEF